MRVLLVSQQYPPTRIAGSELQVQLLASVLSKKGIEPRVLTTRSYGGLSPEQGAVPIDTVNTLGDDPQVVERVRSKAMELEQFLQELQLAEAASAETEEAAPQP